MERALITLRRTSIAAAVAALLVVMPQVQASSQEPTPSPTASPAESPAPEPTDQPDATPSPTPTATEEPDTAPVEPGDEDDGPESEGLGEPSPAGDSASPSDGSRCMDEIVEPECMPLEGDEACTALGVTCSIAPPKDPCESLIECPPLPSDCLAGLFGPSTDDAEAILPCESWLGEILNPCNYLPDPCPLPPPSLCPVSPLLCEVPPCDPIPITSDCFPSPPSVVRCEASAHTPSYSYGQIVAYGEFSCEKSFDTISIMTCIQFAGSPIEFQDGDPCSPNVAENSSYVDSTASFRCIPGFYHTTVQGFTIKGPQLGGEYGPADQAQSDAVWIDCPVEG